MMTIEKIWITETAVWSKTDDGREACEKFSDYPRLKFATQAQRENYTADAFGIHWEEIDEDLSFEGFFRQKNTNTLYELFMAHPEIVGIRTNQLPNTYSPDDEEFSLTYEYDKEGYISKIKMKNEDGDSETYTLTWK